LFGDTTSNPPTAFNAPAPPADSKGFASGGLGAFGVSNIQQEAKQEKIGGGFGGGQAQNTVKLGFGSGAGATQPMGFGSNLGASQPLGFGLNSGT
jgi:hypothetical protein